MPVITDEKRIRYLNIQDGRLCEKMPDGSIEKGAGILGHLVNITVQTIRENKDDVNSKVKGEVLRLHFVDSNDYFIVTTWLNSPYASSFFAMMEGIEHTLMLQLGVSQKEVAGKMKPSLFLSQDKTPLRWKYTRDNMQDLPRAEQVWRDGKQVWDYTPQTFFYLDKLKQVIIPRLQLKPNPFPYHGLWKGLNIGNHIAGSYFGAEERSGPKNHVASATQEPGTTGVELTEPLDDLPF